MKYDFRRWFDKQAAVAASVFTIVPRHALWQGFIAPRDTLYIAGIMRWRKRWERFNHFAGTPDGKTKGNPNPAKNRSYAMWATGKPRVPKNFRRQPITKTIAWCWIKRLHIDAVCVSTPDHYVCGVTAAMVRGMFMQKPPRTIFMKPGCWPKPPRSTK